MAKRVYTPKTISPEIARENAVSAARATVAYARRDVESARALVDRVTTHGAVAADAVGGEIDAEKARQELAWKTADLERAEANLAALEG